ncbi:MAG TPA: ribonuclease P protein component [Ruminococcaceae bacterium]|nr:ribonuclease P protein component [Oscillospiraceae bacterium]
MPFESLKLNKDFRRAYYRGKNQCHPALVSYVLRTRSGGVRLGITASKKIGCAVKRNRARRVIKEAFRLLYPKLGKALNCDIVFAARAKTAKVKMQSVYGAMAFHLKKAGLIL